MRAFALVIALLMIVPAAAALTLSETGATGEMIVGYKSGGLENALNAVTNAGGVVQSRNEDLRTLVVKPTSSATSFAQQVLLSLAVEYTEKNDVTYSHGSQWNGAQWNGAEWNGAQWNANDNASDVNALGAQWNGAQWNGAQWNGAEWNGAQWNSGPEMPSPDPGRAWQWALQAIRASDAWNVTTGSRSAKLCVLDTGADLSHPDLVGNLGAGANMINSSALPTDDAGHGSHIAGIAAGEIGNGFGVAGVGNTRIVPVKVLKSDGTGKESDLVNGITWCAKNGAKVIVMALGVTRDGPTVARAIEFARSRDVVVLASAGNNGGEVGYPASDPNVVAVSALDASGNLASFSARGAAIDLSAPGVDIFSTYSSGRYAFGSGTSQAVALAAGAATLLRDAQPGLSANQTIARLQSTALDMGAAGPDGSYGHGMVNVAAALG